MKFTLDQALQKAVEAHKEGKLQDAELLYRAILQEHPNHPDANHNLGVMAVSLNKAEVALPLFKTALEANSNQGQFWLSYIDALIKEKQFDDARNLMEQGKKRGLVGEKVEAIEKQLTTIFLMPNSKSFFENKALTFAPQRKQVSTKKNKKKNSSRNLISQNKAKSPSAIEINTLLENYKTGRYDVAQNLATLITQQYPSHPFGWKVLGALFRQAGKLEDSVIVNQKVLEISPNDAEAHSNLGNTLHELGRLDEAEASCKKAIEIKPDLAETHNNLGNTLKDLGRLQEAEQSYKKAISIKPDYVEAHYNLGFVLKEFGRFAEAQASYSQAIRLKPKYIIARNEMLTCLFITGQKSLLFDQLDFLIEHDVANAVIGSLTYRSALRYGEERFNIFCDEPLKYALLVDLKSRYNFEETFIRNAKSILSQDKKLNKRQTLLSNGYQTSGNLFDLESKLTDQIQKTIRLEIERYRINFESSEEGFIRKWPNEYRLYGWLISMKSGGELLPHIHENGWLSGSIYINVPANSKNDSGKLVVALGKDSDATNARQNPKKIMDVVTGSMALFPASLMHHTIPFESEEERIVLAFDVVPKS
jgi:tetratricopeptide (TPR) repeat protein